MLELTQPWALGALIAVPWIRWLHRFQERGGRRLVPAIFLWEGLSAGAGGGRRRLRPDPVWRRRALAAACLALALAGPVWTRPQPLRIHLWWDQPPSMEAREPAPSGPPRYARALDALGAALASVRSGHLWVHRLRLAVHPLELSLPLDGAGLERLRVWLEAAGPASGPPLAAALDPALHHWLVSDGSDPAVARWLRSRPVERVLPAGRETENLALVGLGLRRRVDADGGLAVVLEVMNAGGRPARARVGLADATPGGPVRLSLAPGARRLVHWRLAAVPARVAARLERLGGQEALTRDDRLGLGTRSFAPLGMAVDESCPPQVRRAVAAHPGLRVTAGAGGLRIHCGPHPPAGRRTGLWLSTGPSPQPIAGPLLWLGDEPRSLAVRVGDGGRWYPPAVTPEGQPLVRLGERAVAWWSRREGPLVRCALDPGAGAPGAWWPVLFAALVDRLAGRPVLDPRPDIHRPPSAARIAPVRLRPTRARNPAGARGESLDLSPLALGLALLLVGLDLARRWRTA